MGKSDDNIGTGGEWTNPLKRWDDESDSSTAKVDGWLSKDQKVAAPSLLATDKHWQGRQSSYAAATAERWQDHYEKAMKVATIENVDAILPKDGRRRAAEILSSLRSRKPYKDSPVLVKLLEEIKSLN